jgi:hypothetical protein
MTVNRGGKVERAALELSLELGKVFKKKGSLVMERLTPSFNGSMEDQVAANNTLSFIDAVRSFCVIYSCWQGHKLMLCKDVLNFVRIDLIHTIHFAVEYWRLLAAFE